MGFISVLISSKVPAVKELKLRNKVQLVIPLLLSDLKNDKPKWIRDRVIRVELRIENVSSSIQIKIKKLKIKKFDPPSVVKNSNPF